MPANERDRDNSGVLFPETSKKSERSPDYTGRATIAGTRYRVAAWEKAGKRGAFFSLAFSEEEDERSERPF